MQQKNREGLMQLAEIIDTLRIFPRLFLLIYLFWIIRLTDRMVSWFIHLPAVERTVIVTSFFSIATTGIFGLFIWIYKIYSDGGRDWASSPVIPPVTLPAPAPMIVPTVEPAKEVSTTHKTG